MPITLEDIKRHSDEAQVYASGFLYGVQNTLNWAIRQLEKGEKEANGNTKVESVSKSANTPEAKCN